MDGSSTTGDDAGREQHTERNFMSEFDFREPVSTIRQPPSNGDLLRDQGRGTGVNRGRGRGGAARGRGSQHNPSRDYPQGSSAPREVSKSQESWEFSHNIGDVELKFVQLIDQVPIDKGKYTPDYAINEILAALPVHMRSSAKALMSQPLMGKGKGVAPVPGPGKVNPKTVVPPVADQARSRNASQARNQAASDDLFE